MTINTKEKLKNTSRDISLTPGLKKKKYLNVFSSTGQAFLVLGHPQTQVGPQLPPNSGQLPLQSDRQQFSKGRPYDGHRQPGRHSQLLSQLLLRSCPHSGCRLEEILRQRRSCQVSGIWSQIIKNYRPLWNVP